MKIKNKISFFKKAKSILGMNARNLLYVGRHNTRDAKRFADNKLYTKNYLSSRNIGAAKVFNVIKQPKELYNLNPKSFPNSFVIKPNRGFGGEGIFVIKARRGNTFVDVNDNEHSWKDMVRHMIAILDGKYAISGLSDQVIVEERLEMAEEFRRFTTAGLPDIRVIVFNYVPIIAMLRLPTEESSGKANLHLGAVGVGIDISSGKATYAVQNNEFIRRLPNGERVSAIEVPNWDEVLKTAAKAQQVSQIGFLAVDIVATTTGVKVLELNARAGLSVQIANQIPLKNRLEKVADLKVPSPEKGVEISKTIFSPIKVSDKSDSLEDKLVVGLFERIDILNTDYRQIISKIDPHAEYMLIDESLKGINLEKKFIKIQIRGRSFRLPAKLVDLKDQKVNVIVPGKYLAGALVDVSIGYEKVKETPFVDESAKKVGEKILANIDKKLHLFDQQLNILGYIKPINLDREKENFLRDPKVSPRFFYRQPEIDLNKMRRDLKALPQNIKHPLAPLYTKKIEELQIRIKLIESIDTPQLQKCSEKLFGKVDRDLYNKAVEFIKSYSIKEDHSEELTFKETKEKLEKFLKGNKLSHWKIKIPSRLTSDIAINKKGVILLRDGIIFTKNRLKAVITHEICTHVYRTENGRLQKYGIFEFGTAGYMTTEEGLAVYNQTKLDIPMGEKDIWPAFRVVGAYLADSMSFVELFHHIKQEFGIDNETAWKTCLKAKRGLIDTNKKIAFTRDIVYFQGYNLVKKYLNQHGDEGLKKLYRGKIGVGDLRYFEEIELEEARFLPQ